MANLALKKWRGGATLETRKIEMGPLKTVFKRKRVSSKRFATKLEKQAYFIIAIWQTTYNIHLLLTFTAT